MRLHIQGGEEAAAAAASCCFPAACSHVQERVLVQDRSYTALTGRGCSVLLWSRPASASCIEFPIYRVSHPLVDWVGLTWVSSVTLCQILPELLGILQKRLGRWTKWWNTQIKVNPI